MADVRPNRIILHAKNIYFNSTYGKTKDYIGNIAICFWILNKNIKFGCCFTNVTNYVFEKALGKKLQVKEKIVTIQIVNRNLMKINPST